MLQYVSPQEIIHSFISISSVAALSCGSRADPENTELQVGIHPGWDVRLTVGTMHTHSFTPQSVTNDQDVNTKRSSCTHGLGNKVWKSVHCCHSEPKWCVLIITMPVILQLTEHARITSRKQSLPGSHLHSLTRCTLISCSYKICVI